MKQRHFFWPFQTDRLFQETTPLQNEGRPYMVGKLLMRHSLDRRAETQ